MSNHGGLEPTGYRYSGDPQRSSDPAIPQRNPWLQPSAMSSNEDSGHILMIVISEAASESSSYPSFSDAQASG